MNGIGTFYATMPAPYARPDLFVKRISNGFELVSGLSKTQRAEALALVDAEYPPIAYGAALQDDNIYLGSAD